MTKTSIKFAGKEVKNPALRFLLGWLGGIIGLVGVILALIAVVLSIIVIPLSILFYPLDRLRMKLFKSNKVWISIKFK